ncbi:MAG: transposase [Chloroflexota bacterium]
MRKDLLDLYSDYLISSFSLATATGLSEMMDGAYSHDQITRMLGAEKYSQKQYWQMVKPIARQVEQEDAAVLVDDTIEEKPHTDESELVCWHYDHSQGRSVKGINLLNFVYYSHTPTGQEVSFPVAYETVTKPEQYQDPKTKKWKRRSLVSKNDLVKERLKILSKINHLKFKYVINDIWFSSKDTMKWIKTELQKEFVMALKSNRLVALSEQDKSQGHFVALADLELKTGQCRLVYLKGIPFPVIVAKQIFTNKDGSTGTLFLVSSETSLTYDQLTTLYQKRWKVEVIHKSLKQNAALERSPTKTIRSQSNHIFAAMIAVTKLECLKLAHHSNHFALKSKLYLKALKAAFEQLQHLNCPSLHSVKFQSA